LNWRLIASRRSSTALLNLATMSDLRSGSFVFPGCDLFGEDIGLASDDDGSAADVVDLGEGGSVVIDSSILDGPDVVDVDPYPAVLRRPAGRLDVAAGEFHHQERPWQ
jgi:hypothetical protein